MSMPEMSPPAMKAEPRLSKSTPAGFYYSGAIKKRLGHTVFEITSSPISAVLGEWKPNRLPGSNYSRLIVAIRKRGTLSKGDGNRSSAQNQRNLVEAK